MAEIEAVMHTSHFNDQLLNGVWLGNYQRAASTDAADGWDVCSRAGENASALTPAWAETEPDDRNGDEGCAFLWNGMWFDDLCEHNHRCLCEYGSGTSSAYQARVDAYIARMHAIARDMFLVEGLLALLPLLVPLASAAYRRTCRRGLRRGSGADTAARGTALPATMSAIAVEAATVELADPSPAGQASAAAGVQAAVAGAQAAAPGAPTAPGATDTSLATIVEAERAAERLRTRVSGSIAWAGWVLCVAGLGPFVVGILLIDLTPVAYAALRLLPGDHRKITCTQGWSACVLAR